MTSPTSPENAHALPPLALPEAPPRWDLSDLYPSRQDPALVADLDKAATQARAFKARWQGKLGESGAGLASALEAYEKLDELLSRAATYSYLQFAEASTDPAAGRLLQDVREKITALSADLLFFSLEINRIEDAPFEVLLADQALAGWATYLRDMRSHRPHQLSDELEQALMDMDVTGRSAWVRLFDETMAALTVELNGQTRPLDEAFTLMMDPDRTVRAKAAKAISATLGRNNHLLASITNTLAKDKATRDKMRSFSRPVSARNLANRVEDEVVDALDSAVEAAFPRLSHRYYSLKAGWLGLDRLEHWDRNAPLPGVEARPLSWGEGASIVRQAYHGFDPEMGALADRFLTNSWIDAAPVPGKASGAFAHPAVPSVHPYILMSYRGQPRDVMTLAHEMGHGIHQVLAGQAQGHLRSSTPLTLAETASVFGEMLTFCSLLGQAPTLAHRRHLIASKVEDMLNTVVRQMAFYQFESKVHAERTKGEIPAARLGEIWRDVQQRSLGPAFNFTPDYDQYWSYIPHFIHSPFYVYAYAFGDCLVNALYGVYSSQPDGFAPRYKALLSAGGSKRHHELLAPFGLDARDPAFWNIGLDVISGLIDELEAMPAA
ncbi:M3 family oligoendopeptidase [Formicincola oecophyllae]|uniref:M3 family oligoendopeptidase n=1 Tax=Formicincola oecophyllae TaxID=2558361 RepID=A0A4Y6U9L9_9PROT|nr:M3 family oligoendopeptidase [Formicincola oecophyllae]QDH13904.1 M3 family oligoendopeptidase [Formicincola oecophyllae]